MELKDQKMMNTGVFTAERPDETSVALWHAHVQGIQMDITKETMSPTKVARSQSTFANTAENAGAISVALWHVHAPSIQKVTIKEITRHWNDVNTVHLAKAKAS